MYLEALAHWPMWVSLGAVVLTIVVYTLDRWSMELVSISVIAALLLVFSLPGATALDGSSISPSNLLSGFSNPALITIMALLVVGQGLFHTGALEAPTRALIKSYNQRPTVTILTAFLAVFMTSALTNNTPVVIMFLPIMSALAGRMGASTSKLMMPLSFVSIMAGMTTLIGTSTNLLAADGYKRITGEQLGFFDQTEFGLILAAIGGLYLLIASRYILPDREGFAETMVRSGKQFVAQFEVTPGHFLDGNKAVAGMFPRLGDMTIRLIQRGEKAILPPYDDLTLIPGDIV
ncbi:MAG: SLC13 family permease, partial [Henriciella sp.]